MTEPAAVRQVTTALSFAYPVLAHFAVARNSAGLTIAALALLAAISLLPGLARGAATAWLAVPIVGGVCWWLSGIDQPLLPGVPYVGHDDRSGRATAPPFAGWRWAACAAPRSGP